MRERLGKEIGASEWNRTTDLGLMRTQLNIKKPLILQGFREFRLTI